MSTYNEYRCNNCHAGFISMSNSAYVCPHCGGGNIARIYTSPPTVQYGKKYYSPNEKKPKPEE